LQIWVVGKDAEVVEKLLHAAGPPKKLLSEIAGAGAATDAATKERRLKEQGASKR
jgi:hypothetical protein